MPNSASSIHPGQFRLSRIQLINWGTFHGVFTIDVARQGFLITGPSGSGKSSLLDAISTVLVPQQNVRYNAASQQGVNRRNGRDLVSYVRGAWRQVENPETGEIQSEYLRTGATYSVIGLTFSNSGAASTASTESAASAASVSSNASAGPSKSAGKTYTLLAIFRLSGGENSRDQVKRFFGIVSGDIDINELSPLLAKSLDTRKIKAAFKDRGATFTKTYSTFADRFRQRLGINSEEAQLLLHRTQSAKSLNNLDQLFRDYMLDEPSTFAKAEDAVAQFEDLRQAYLRVEDVKAQIDTLSPLPELKRDLDQARQTRTEADAQLDAIPEVRRRVTIKELEVQLRQVTAQVDGAEAQTQAAAEQVRHKEDSERTAYQALSNLSEGQLSSLQEKIEHVQYVIDTRQKKLASLGLSADTRDKDYELTAQGIAELQATSRLVVEEFPHDESAQSAKVDEESATVRALNTEIDGLDRELRSLGKRSSNIESHLVDLRANLAAATGYNPGEFPFAGELFDIVPEEKAWEPVIQKLLHGFAATLLVPESAREAVSAWVSENNLRTRLEYRTVSATSLPVPRGRDSRRLVYKLAFSDHVLSDWIRHHIATAFDYLCVPTRAALADAAQTHSAVTPEGLVQRKNGRDGSQHFIKDDRTRFQGTTWYRIGSSNLDKVETLRAHLEHLKQKSAAAQHRWQAEKKKLEALKADYEQAQQIIATQFSEIDVASEQARKEELLEQLARMQSSPELAELSAAHERALAELTVARDHHEECLAARGAARQRLQDLKQRREVENDNPVTVDAEVAAAVEKKLRGFSRVINLDTIPNLCERLQRDLQGLSRRSAQTIESRSTAIVQTLAQYLSKWPAESADLEDKVEFAGEGIAKLEYLRADRLAEFRGRFLDLLNGTTVQNLSELATALRRAKSDIETRMAFINKSLLRSPYNPGRFLQIEVKDNRGELVREFQRDLDAATSHSLIEASEENHTRALARYHALDKILSRLGSEESGDKSWRNLVLDTRRHVAFVGREIDGSGATVNTYQSSASLSGGQAQKLVFFCLAAALRYRLADVDADTPTYGTIVLDEAFDRADPAFTKIAMDVFTQFGFHMILATPFKQIKTLSPYVDGTIVINYSEPTIRGVATARTTFSYIDASAYSPTGTPVADTAPDALSAHAAPVAPAAHPSDSPVHEV